MTSVPPANKPPARNDRRWTRVSNGIVTMIVGCALFGLGATERLGPVGVLGALIIAAGGVVLVVGLIGGSP